MDPRHFQVLIVGGGTAGITAAARLRNERPDLRIGLIEPSPDHHYQPIWTLVGAGVVPRESSRRATADLIPSDVEWIQERVTSFDPVHDAVTTDSGARITYDDLVVTLGIRLDWEAIEGLPEALGTEGVCSNYAYESVSYTWDLIRSFRGGNAIFTFPRMPIKCAGAPQKIMYLAEHAFRRAGIRDRTNVIYGCTGPAIFGIPKYRRALEKIIADRGIETRFRHELVALDAPHRRAVFRDGEGRSVEIPYEMIHVTPPQSSPEVIRNSPLADAAGWVDVDKYTTRHVRYPNVFSIGDCSSLPTSKTGAAVRKQAPVMVANLLAGRAGDPLPARYDGYASCPLVTGYGKVILAEFGYDGEVMETFPFDQAQERYSMWLLKLHGLPSIYWHGMLRGRM